MSNSEGVSSVSSPTKKTAAFVLLRPVSRDFLLIFVLNLRICRSNLSTTKSILAYKSGDVSSARKTR